MKTHPLPAYLCADNVKLHGLEMAIIRLHDKVKAPD